MILAGKYMVKMAYQQLKMHEIAISIIDSFGKKIHSQYDNRSL